MNHNEALHRIEKIEFEGGFFDAISAIGLEELLSGTPFSDPTFVSSIERALQIEREFMQWLEEKAEI